MDRTTCILQWKDQITHRNLPVFDTVKAWWYGSRTGSRYSNIINRQDIRQLTLVFRDENLNREVLLSTTITTLCNHELFSKLIVYMNFTYLKTDDI